MHNCSASEPGFDFGAASATDGSTEAAVVVGVVEEEEEDDDEVDFDVVAFDIDDKADGDEQGPECDDEQDGDETETDTPDDNEFAAQEDAGEGTVVNEPAAADPLVLTASGAAATACARSHR